MLTTSDPGATRQAFDALKLPFEEHGGAGPEMDGMTIGDLRKG